MDLSCRSSSVHYVTMAFRRRMNEAGLEERNKYIEVWVGMAHAEIDIEGNQLGGTTGDDVGLLVNYSVKQFNEGYCI